MSHRVSDYSGRLPPAPLRPVAGFPGLRLLRGLRRRPGFSSRLLGTSVSGRPPTFTLVGSTEEFRRRLAHTTQPLSAAPDRGRGSAGGPSLPFWPIRPADRPVRLPSL